MPANAAEGTRHQNADDKEVGRKTPAQRKAGLLSFSSEQVSAGGQESGHSLGFREIDF